MTSRDSAIHRLALIDLIRAIASQLIVLHHLAFYGPMAELVRPIAPRLIDWLADDARIAVQAFLVVAGHLAARSLAPGHDWLDRRATVPSRERSVGDWARIVWRRYLRVTAPFAVALVVAMFCAELARLLIGNHSSVPGIPSLGQFLAHLALLHGVLGFESLSGGAWYVAIDFQLYLVFVVLLACTERLRAGPAPLIGIVVGLVTLSLLHFNRDSRWDDWAPYFFGAWGLGVLSHWAAQAARQRRALPVWPGLVVLLTLAALIIDFRSRIAVAVIVAVLIGAAEYGHWLHRWPRSRVVQWFSRISYSVFLLNFPVGLVVNAYFSRFMPATPEWQAIGFMLGWAACVMAGALFHRHVESPLMRRLAPMARARGAATQTEQHLSRPSIQAIEALDTRSQRS